MTAVKNWSDLVVITGNTLPYGTTAYTLLEKVIVSSNGIPTLFLDGITPSVDVMNIIQLSSAWETIDSKVNDLGSIGFQTDPAFNISIFQGDVRAFKLELHSYAVNNAAVVVIPPITDKTPTVEAKPVVYTNSTFFGLTTDSWQYMLIMTAIVVVVISIIMIIGFKDGRFVLFDLFKNVKTQIQEVM
jgi:hypothetical protein